MNRKRSSLFLTLVAGGALSLGLMGCGGGYSKPPSTAPPYMPPAANNSLKTPVDHSSVPGASSISSSSVEQSNAGR